MVQRLVFFLMAAILIGGCAPENVPAGSPRAPTATAGPASPIAVSPVQATTAASGADLFLPPGPSANVAVPTTSPTVIRSRVVSVNFDLLAKTQGPPSAAAGTTKTITLNLFDDARFVGVADRVEPNPRGLSWTGHLDGVPQSQVTMVVQDQAMSATIRLPGKVFIVRSAGAGLVVISQVDPKAFPPD